LVNNQNSSISLKTTTLLHLLSTQIFLVNKGNK